MEAITMSMFMHLDAMMEQYEFLMIQADEELDRRNFGLVLEYLMRSKDLLEEIREIGFRFGSEKLVNSANAGLMKVQDHAERVQFLRVLVQNGSALSVNAGVMN
jgi:hypothetical protein